MGTGTHGPPRNDRARKRIDGDHCSATTQRDERVTVAISNHATGLVAVLERDISDGSNDEPFLVDGARIDAHHVHVVLRAHRRDGERPRFGRNEREGPARLEHHARIALILNDRCLGAINDGSSPE